jgi:hypothetical protein
VNHLHPTRTDDENELKILEALSSVKELSGRKIQLATGISPRYVQRYLRNLVRSKLITEQGKSTWKIGKSLKYSITAQGQKMFEQKLICYRTTTKPNVTTELLVKNHIAMTLGQEKIYQHAQEIDTAFLHTPLGKMPISIFLWTNYEVRERKPAILEELMKHETLQLLASHFIHNLKRAVLNSEITPNQISEGNPLQMKDIINQERKSLNSDSMILIHFNGEKIVKTVDWNSELKKFEANDRMLRESWVNFKKSIASSGTERDNWIVDEIIERAVESETSIQEFLLRFFEGLIVNSDDIKSITDNPWVCFDSRDKLVDRLVEKLAWRACRKIEYDNDGNIITTTAKPFDIQLASARIEIKKKIKALEQEGCIEFVPTFHLKIKDKKKALAVQEEAMKGYPNPDIAIME